MADGVWKGVWPKGFGRSKQLLLNKFFDSIIPSMRAPQKSKMAARGPQTQDLGRSHPHQLSLNKFFDPSTRSMRKVYDGKRKKKRENNVVFSGH